LLNLSQIDTRVSLGGHVASEAGRLMPVIIVTYVFYLYRHAVAIAETQGDDVSMHLDNGDDEIIGNDKSFSNVARYD
jgi:hypothetical protein